MERGKKKGRENKINGREREREMLHIRCLSFASMKEMKRGKKKGKEDKINGRERECYIVDAYHLLQWKEMERGKKKGREDKINGRERERERMNKRKK